MKNLFRFVLTVMMILGSLPGRAQAANWQAKVDPLVLETSAQGDAEFLIFMTEQADVSGAAHLATKLEKGTYVLNKLNEVAQRTQPAVIAVLKKYGVEYRTYRVANLIWARGSRQVIRALAERTDVARLYANPHVTLAEPATPASPPEVTQPGSPSAPETIEWNITKVKAPQVWAAGFTGQGAVIGGQDTGYQWDHPALINHYRGWNGTTANHDYNWHDSIHNGGTGYCHGDYPEPCDGYGHGTHTMGTMVGDDGGTNQIGMAPGAKWIGCRNMDNSGTGSPASYTECFDWFLAPYPVGGTPAQGDPSKAPDVISNSWTCPASEGCLYDTLKAIVNNVVAAGIVVVAAAGNSGSGCNTISDPPALYDASFTIGATDSSDNIAGFSSRGPVTVDGSYRMKPDISAPGVGVRSSIPGGGYGQMSGTSMATPHVAGLVGLLISAQPALRGHVDAIEALIEGTALPRTTSQNCGGVPGTHIPNNTYGWGRINALAAYQGTHQLLLTKTASAASVIQGESLTYTLAITHTQGISPTMNVVLTDTIPAGVDFLGATQPYSQNGNIIEWDFPSLGPGASTGVTMTVGVPFTLTGTITNAAYGVRSDEVATVMGSPVETSVIPYLPTLTKTAPARVASGAWMTYHLDVGNANPYGPDLHHLVLTDTQPANTSFVAATQPYILSSQVITWELPVLPAGSQWGVTLTVQSSPTFAGTIYNNAYGFASDENGVVSGTPVRTDIYGLKVNKTASATTVKAGNPLTYTLTVTNLHPTLATYQLILSDTLPAGVVFLGATQPFSQVGNGIEWDFPSLGPGASTSVTMTVGAPLTLTGTITNAVYGVRSDEVATVMGSPVETSVIPYRPTLTKTAPSRVAPGDWLTYNLTVANPNPHAPDVNHLVLTDTLPANTSFVAATQPYTLSNQVVTWKLPVLPAGSQWGVTLTVQSPFTFTGTISNTAYGLTSDEYGVISGPPVRTEIYGLSVDKTASAATVMPGDLLTYTLTVTNLHPTLTTDHLVLSDTLPAGVQFISATGVYTISGDQIVWNLDALAPGGTWQVKITVRVNPDAAGSIINVDYQVRSDQVPIPVTGTPVKITVWRKIWLPVMLTQ